ncbi:MAG TPA: hypothetical protein VJ208_01015 [Candidatus Nanoarchaeia archaeon]|nr:hypothetical protein [Candidatus Nanoarchaeia archaeon]
MYLISLDSGRSLEDLAQSYWRIMLDSEENIPDSKEREIQAINYLDRTYCQDIPFK